MEKRSEKKPQDRRSRYTRSVIKDTMLDFLQKKRFEKISVTEICKNADINRGTFYLHYLDTYDVLDDLVDDFLSNTSDTVHHVSCPQKSTCTNSLCDRVQSSSKYQPLFLDDTAAGKILEKLKAKGLDRFVSYLLQNSNLTREQAEGIFLFQINGCLAVNRMMLQNRTENWPQIQHAIDGYIGAGLRFLALPPDDPK